MKTIPYRDNTEPKVGDRVVATHKPYVIYEVTAVQLGRLGNKIAVRDAPNATPQEYYYYCFQKVIP